MKANEKLDVREIRRKLGLNQSQFWSKIGVTQSGGSRYESGRNIPRPVQALLRLVHVEQIDINKVKRDDVEVAEYLKTTNPELYKTLKKEARAKRKERGAHAAHDQGLTRTVSPFFRARSAIASSSSTVSVEIRGASACIDGRATP